MTSSLKALTLHQPWASLIPLGLKPHETRSWRTSHRGPLAIHAAKLWGWVLRWNLFALPPSLKGCLADVHGPLDFLAPLPLGAVVAVADIVDCVPVEDVRGTLSPDQIVNARLRVDALARVLGDRSPSVLVLNASSLLKCRVDALAAALNDAYSNPNA